MARKIRFFDTSALQHRYMDGPFSRRVRYAVSDTRCDSYISDWTVLEIASALGNRCRQSNLDASAYDRMNRAFFHDVAERVLIVRESGHGDVMNARNLLRYAVVVNRKKLRSADAFIAAGCLELARGTPGNVIFYTSDWPLYQTVRVLPTFTSVMKIRYVGIPKEGVPAET